MGEMDASRYPDTPEWPGLTQIGPTAMLNI